MLITAQVLVLISMLFSATRGLLSSRFTTRRFNSRTFATTANAPVAKVTVGPPVIHPSYEVVEVSNVDEYGVQATVYTHKKSGAQVMSVNAADENKVFGITFRTPPSDSTGIPHILEHSVLCGSRKFPVKEPFVDLLKGSLQNFLNAFTYPDRTCYPVASTNTKDFYNLVHVYLDAVLHPRAINDPQVLQQEGWHFELEDPSQPLTYKGVVYNEMKGVYSSPDSILGRATQQALFPDNTYGVDSGGDPLVIPSLNFETFKNFHSTYYHPSNSRIFFYGNDDPLKRLELLDEYLSEFNRIPVDSQVKFQKKTAKPHYKEVRFPLAKGTEPKHMVTVNWLLNDAPLSAKESLALGVLDDLLMGTPSAKLRKTLTESGLGESVTGGLSDELLQATFGVGLKGLKPENVDKVQELVLSTFDDISKNGFEESAIQASLNTFEFRLREFNTGSFPRGLSIMLSMMAHWIYDKNPVDGVRFEDALQALKDDLKNGVPVFQDLIKKYIVSNEHRVTVEMKPDKNIEAEVVAQETEKLSKIKDTLTQKEIDDIIESTKKLKAAQLAEDSAEAKKSIPRLSLEDIDRESRELPIEVVQDGKTDPNGVTILTHTVPSNGILYLDFALDYSQVSHEDLVLLPLFSRMIMEAGTAQFDEVSLSRKIGAETGGISTSYYSDLPRESGKVANPDDAILYFMLRGKAVREKIPVMVDIMTDVLLNARLDNQKRAVEMLKESKVRRRSSVITSGNSYGATRLAAKYSFLGYLNEMTGGLTSVRESSKLVTLAESDWPALQSRLERIRNAIVKKGTVVINLTADEKTLDAALPVVKKIVDVLPAAQSVAATLQSEWKRSKDEKKVPNVSEGFAVPSQVNYVCKAGSLYNPGDEVSGSSSVVSRFLSTGYLWDNVRVVGGAYGGFARFSEATGRFVYMSYRDPNLVDTLKIYDGTSEALGSAELHDEDVLQAVIGAVGDLDGPLSPDQKGYASMVQYLVGESPADRQKWRDDVLGTSKGDFAAFAEKLKTLEETSSVVVFGSQAALEQANKELGPEKALVIEPAFTDA